MSSLPSYAVAIFQQSEKLRGKANWHSFAEAFINFCTGVGAEHIVADSALNPSKTALDNAIGYVLSGMLEKDVKDGVPGKHGGQELYKALKASCVHRVFVIHTAMGPRDLTGGCPASAQCGRRPAGSPCALIPPASPRRD
ncbi:uncharacterized protein SCHCODRAFT_01103664 [Schizophyllum commune H4-8]|nr:uncharacterized protein SCHCODRAFT_01103664 [Schizophyllum commune H4-8]KAI5887750.1 hypothetical protein SCHCODRAFT_01103664 [Schizophyllum commune H4-8]